MNTRFIRLIKETYIIDIQLKRETYIVIFLMNIDLEVIDLKAIFSSYFCYRLALALLSINNR